MAAIHSFMKRIMGILPAKIGFVAGAFALMIISSGLYVNVMLRNHLHRDATDMLTKTMLKIESEFIEPQTTLLAISETVRSMILNGGSEADVLELITLIAGRLQEKPNGFDFDGIFGYFEVFGGNYIDEKNWDIPEDYDPTTRPWYKAATAPGNYIAVSPIYWNVQKKDNIITHVCRISDDDGNPLGMVCMNMPLNNIRRDIESMKITEGSYGILEDDRFDVIYHPNPDFVGKNIYDLNTYNVETFETVKESGGFYKSESPDADGVYMVRFAAKLDNGWILSILTPKSEYYHEMQGMMWILIIMGAGLAAALSVILINLDRSKNKADFKLKETEKMREIGERMKVMLEAAPFSIMIWDKNNCMIDCNQTAVSLFGMRDVNDVIERFDETAPEYQPGGSKSLDVALAAVKKALDEGYYRLEFMHRNTKDENIPTEIILVRVNFNGEINVLAYANDLRELRAAIEVRDNLLNTVNDTAVILLSEDYDDFMSPVMEGMKLLGRSVDVDRVQIWQNETIDGALHFVHKYEWLSETGKTKPPVPIGLKFPYSDMPAWEYMFSRGKHINDLLRNLPQSDRDLLSGFEIKTIIIIPLFLQDKFWGFFSLDDCRNERKFSEEEIKILRSGGLLIANAFLKNDTAIQLKEAFKSAQESNKEKSKFLATMSHEIRTPMNVILGITENYLQDSAIAPEVKNGFKKIYTAGDLLLNIINDILDLSKIEAGKFELRPAKYRVTSLINDVAHMNVIRFQHKPIEFKLKVDENIPSMLFGDELRIKQILNNLLSNAFKYTAAGEVTLSFAFQQAEEEENMVMLDFSVRDTGQGMTAEQIEKIFDEYSRFNLEANRTTVGTGLGMSITRNLINMMNGELKVESTPGKGSVFIARIPQRKDGDRVIGREFSENLQNLRFDDDKIKTRTTKLERHPMPYGKVLVVDDMVSNLDIALLLLKPYSLQAETAKNGFEAVEIIKSGKVYDIIFMDHMMPGMDGVEATRQIRENGYTGTIIALTANAVVGEAEKFLKNGFDSYISKPIDMRQLNDELNKYIRDKHAQT